MRKSLLVFLMRMSLKEVVKVDELQKKSLSALYLMMMMEVYSLNSVFTKVK